MKSRLNRNYLAEAEAKVRQATMSADGRGRYVGRNQRKVAADGWLQRQQNAVSFSGRAENGSFFPADGASGGAVAGAGRGGTSQPIILQISNSSAVGQNVNLWGATVYLDNSSYTWTAGSLVIGNVTISVVSNTTALNTYRSALNSTISQVMTIGQTTVNVLAGSNQQISQTWGLNTFAANANFAGQQFVNVISPQQFQASVIDNFTQYDIDGQTYLQVPVLGNANFQMLFYPISDINLSRSLIGQPAAKSFGPPPGNLAPQAVNIVS